MTYLLFGGEEFYPNGGARDLMGIFDHLDEAEDHFAQNPQVWGEIALLHVGADMEDIEAGYLNVIAVIGERFAEFKPYPEWSAPPARKLNRWLGESAEP